MILALSHQQPELVCRRCSRGGRISKNKPAMTSELCWARRDLQPHFRQSVWQDCNASDGLEKDLKFISQFSMCFLNLVCCTDQFFLTKEEPSKVRCAKLLHFDHSMELPDAYGYHVFRALSVLRKGWQLPKNEFRGEPFTMSLLLYESWVQNNQ